MTVSEHVWIGGGGLRGGGVGGSYQPGVYVPLKALFLVSNYFSGRLLQSSHSQCSPLVPGSSLPYSDLCSSHHG